MKLSFFMNSLVGVLLSCSHSGSCQADSAEMTERLIKDLNQGLILSHGPQSTGAYFVRLNVGLLKMPSAFVLHAGQSVGRSFRLETEPYLSSNLALADIWIWNKDESAEVGDAFERASQVDNDELAELLVAKCALEANRRSIDVPIDGSRYRLRREFLALEDQVISWVPDLNPVVIEMFNVFVDQNCSEAES